MRSALWVGLLLAAFFPARTWADALHLKNGNTLEGKVLSEEGSEIAIRLKGGGEVAFKRADVDWIEWSDRAAVQAECAKRRAAAAGADALVAAGQWAHLHGLRDEAQAAWRAALERDPAHVAAHEALGHHLVSGRWLTEDEYQQSTGHVKRGDRWVTAEAAAKLDMGWEFVNGALLSPDEAQEAKGLVQYEGKWIPKKERDERERRKAAEKAAAGGGKAPPDKGTARPGAPPALADPKDDAAILRAYGVGWRVKSGKHYRLVTNCADKDAAFDQKFVDAMDTQWDVYCDTFGVTPEQKKLHNIVVYGSREEYNAWAAKNAPVGVGAFGVYVHEAAFSPACLGYRDGLRAALYTGRHEGGHQFAAHYLHADGAPWFVEGIATLFEGDIPLNEYPYRWGVVQRDFLGGRVTLAALVRGSATMGADQIYGLGAAVHWFFLTGKAGAYKAAYHKFMATGNTASPESLEKAIGRPLAELEKELVAFVQEMDGRRKR